MSKKKSKRASGEALPKKVETDNSSLDNEAGSSPEPEMVKETVAHVSKPEAIGVPSVDKREYAHLSDAEREALDRKASELADKEFKQSIEDDYLKSKIEALKKEKEDQYEMGDEEPIVRHTVNVASHAGYILINGKQYRHGHTYEVPRSLKAAMLDMEYRGHEQERIRKGNDRNEYNIRERDGIKSGAGVVRA
jgi:hypothetical protein